jgi:hypothetical protein
MRRSFTGCSRAWWSMTPGCSTKRLKEWEDFYNFSRPPGSLGGQTQYERLREKTRAPV